MKIHDFDSEVYGKILTLLLPVIFNHYEPIPYQENGANNVYLIRTTHLKD